MELFPSLCLPPLIASFTLTDAEVIVNNVQFISCKVQDTVSRRHFYMIINLDLRLFIYHGTSVTQCNV